jgi:hypothetical protein
MKIKEFPPITTLQDSDLLVLQNATGTYKSIKASDLKSYCQSGLSSPATTSYTLTFQSSGDTKGAFYCLGTVGTGIGWSNPYKAGFLGISLSSIYDSSNANVEDLVNRTADNAFATSDLPNSWVAVDFRQRKLACNYYSIRARNYDANHLKGWNLQGSNDFSTWTTLHSKTNNPLAANQWYSAATTANQSTFYRFFRILQTQVSTSGDNFLTMGELELYGTLQGGF